MTEAKIPYAFDLQTDAMVHVDAVATGLACGLVCPDCKTTLVAKNKGLVRVHHFAHHNPVGTCEGLLHAMIKQAFYQRAKRCLATASPLAIRWECGVCGCWHTGNLVKRTAVARLEYMIDGVRPDTSGFAADGTTTWFVEVVHTHPPSAQTHEVAQRHGVPIFQLIVESEADICRVQDDGCPLKVLADYCLHASLQCKDCGQQRCDSWMSAPLPHKRCATGPEPHCVSATALPCFCPTCGFCVDNPEEHLHCACGDIIRGPYRQCYCCHVGCKVRQAREHRHCKGCRSVITKRQKYMGVELYFYERCWPCEQNERLAVAERY